VLAPRTHLFDLIYGQPDGPAPGCISKLESDSHSGLANHHGYQTTNAVPGDIADRFRNAKPGQGIGYPMFTLERLFDAAELMRIAGFDPYDYRGAHHQSIEMAIEHYACYAKGAGFYRTVTAENSGSCPNAAQYYITLIREAGRTGLPNYVLFRDDPYFDSLRQRSRFVRLLADLKREWEGYRKEFGGRSRPTVSECRLKVGEH
jgi:hypothetical protein